MSSAPANSRGTTELSQPPQNISIAKEVGTSLYSTWLRKGSLGLALLGEPLLFRAHPGVGVMPQTGLHRWPFAFWFLDAVAQVWCCSWSDLRSRSGRTALEGAEDGATSGFQKKHDIWALISSPSWYLLGWQQVTPTGSAHTRWSHSSAGAQTVGLPEPRWL